MTVRERSVAFVSAGVLATTLLIQMTGAALAVGGNLNHFTVSGSGTSTAGSALSLSVTAKDAMDRAVRSYTGVHCLTFTGLLTSPNGTGPSYPPAVTCAAGQSAVAFTNGGANAAVTAFRAGTNTLTISDPSVPFEGSVTFTVLAAAAATLTFTAQPINTKVSTPIYSVCLPDPGHLDPCATTSETPASSPVAVREEDGYGNLAADAVTILGNSVSPVSGIASFGDLLQVGATGAQTLRATTASGASADSGTFRSVNDLEACSSNRCDNNASTPSGQPLQRAYSLLTTANGQFYVAGQRNVILATQFIGAGAFDGHCGTAAILGDGTEAIASGDGVSDAAPTTTMLLVIPRASLKAFGITSRSASSFDVCVGATWIAAGTPTTWTTKGGGQSSIPDANKVSWGTIADCSAFPVDSPNPCAALKTKQAIDVQNYFGWTASQTSLLMRDSDLGIIVRKNSPWDGKGGVY